MSLPHDRIARGGYRTALPLLLLLLLGCLIVGAFSMVVPYCMDEFLPYNEIIYGHYPFNRLNSFNEAYGAYDLDLFGSGLVVSLRSYDYMGVVPSLYYYPLFLVWDHPATARFLGILFLLSQAWTLSRIVDIRATYLYLGLLAFFPYMFQHLVETGMVGAQILGLLGLVLLIRRWLESLRWGLALSIAGVGFLSVWTKLSFLWYAPALLLLLLAGLWEQRARLRSDGRRTARLGRQALGCVVLFLLLISPLFLSSDPADPGRYPYWEQLVASPYTAGYGLGELLDPTLLRELPLFETLWNPLRATERIYSPAGVSAWSLVYCLLLYAAAPLLWLVARVRRLRDSRSWLRRSMLFYGCFVVTLLMIFRTHESWSMHHTLLAYPFLMLAILTALRGIGESESRAGRSAAFRRWLAAGVGSFLVLNSYYFISFPRQPVDPENHASRIALSRSLRKGELARQHFYVVLDWGMYFYQALYGHPEQSVLYIDPMGPEEIAALKALAQRYNRHLLFIYHPRLPGHNLLAVQQHFEVEACNLTGSPNADGEDWLVLIEKGARLDVCL